MAELHAGGDAGRERSELLAYRLPDGFQGFESVRLLDRMNAKTIGGAVIEEG
jgi:hypothetical protein